MIAEVEEHLKGAHSHRPVDADVDDGGGLLDNVDVHFVDFDLGSKVPTDTTTSQDPSYVPLSSSGLETQQGRNPFEHLELLDMGMSEVPPPFEVMEELYESLEVGLEFVLNMTVIILSSKPNTT